MYNSLLIADCSDRDNHMIIFANDINVNGVCVCAYAVALVVAVVCVLAGAWNWLTDPETPKVWYDCNVHCMFLHNHCCVVCCGYGS